MPDVHIVSFLAIVAFVVVAGVTAIERVPGERRRTSPFFARHPRLTAAGWLVATALPTLLGAYRPDGPLPPQLLMLIVLGAALGLGLSPVGGEIAARVPIHALVAFQGFRFPLELVLHRWVELGVAPPQMTWTGANVDIVAGVLALAAAPIVWKWPRAGWLPTGLGILLLANVVLVVARSLPGPLQAYPDAITLPHMFPHVWIATVCVTGAAAAHVVAVRALLGHTPHGP